MIRKRVLRILAVCSPVLLLAGGVVAQAKPTKPPKPLDVVWNAINNLQDQIDSIELIPGPPGLQGDQGEPGSPGDQGDQGDYSKNSISYPLAESKKKSQRDSSQCSDLVGARGFEPLTPCL